MQWERAAGSLAKVPGITRLHLAHAYDLNVPHAYDLNVPGSNTTSMNAAVAYRNRFKAVFKNVSIT